MREYAIAAMDDKAPGTAAELLLGRSADPRHSAGEGFQINLLRKRSSHGNLPGVYSGRARFWIGVAGGTFS